MDNNHNKTLPKKEVSLKEIIQSIIVWLQYLLSRKQTILIFTFVGAILGLVLALFSQVNYKANVVFVLSNNNKAEGGYSGLAAQLGFNIGGGKEGLFSEDDNLITFMKSRTMIAQTFLSEGNFNGKKELLVDRYVDAFGMRKTWENTSDLKDFKFQTNPELITLKQDSLINTLYDHLERKHLSLGKPDKKGDIIVASLTTPDELLSKIFIEKLLDNVTGFYINTQTGKTEENIRILQHQVDSIRVLVNIALSGVASTTEANPNPNPAFQRLKVPSQKKMIDLELNKVVLQELVRNLEISKISLRKETPLVQIIDKPVLPLEKERLGKLKGIILGGFLGGFLVVTFLSLKRLFRGIMT